MGSATRITIDLGVMFPFTVVPVYNLPVYASQRPVPDARQDSVRGCLLGFAAAVIADGRLQRACKAQTGSPEAVARPRFPQNVACGFTAPRSSAVGSQHCKRLQLPVREAQFRFQQRCPFFDLVEGVPSEASACPTAAAQQSAPVTRHDPVDLYETPEISGA